MHIMDMNMPGTNGLDALELLQAHEPTSSVPILLLTGDTRKQ
ncbi:response regulator [Paenibacillus sp. YYML68]